MLAARSGRDLISKTKVACTLLIALKWFKNEYIKLGKERAGHRKAGRRRWRRG